MSASITPLMVPPLATSMIGYEFSMKMSPVAITSACRNQTMLSPSLCAAGMYDQLDLLAAAVFRGELLVVDVIRLVRPRFFRRRGHLSGRRAHAGQHLFMRDHHRAFTGNNLEWQPPSGVVQLFVAANMVRRCARVDDVGDRLRRELR